MKALPKETKKYTENSRNLGLKISRMFEIKDGACSFPDRVDEIFDSSSTYSKDRNEKLKDYLSSQSSDDFCFEVKAKLKSPLIVGDSSFNGEYGFIMFDRNSGLPYIPASTIKGVLRSACTSLYDKAKASLLFGDDKDKKQGCVIVFDSIMYDERTNINPIRLEISNPHHAEYMEGKKYPTDKETPIPVYFLAAKEGTSWSFFIVIKKIEGVCELKEDVKSLVKKLFEKVFSEGIGAKTTIGYGRFEYLGIEEIESKTPIVKQKEASKKVETPTEICKMVGKCKKISREGEVRMNFEGEIKAKFNKDNIQIDIERNKFYLCEVEKTIDAEGNTIINVVRVISEVGNNE